MATRHNQFQVLFKQNFIWLGIGLGLTYWLLESWLHIALFKGENFAAQIMTTDPHEIWKRLLVLTLFTLFGIYFQFSINVRRRTEAALHERERELSLIMENNPAGIMLVDCEHRTISMANTNALKMIGSSREALEGHICHTFLCPAETGNCPVLDHNQTIDISERTLLQATGEPLPILKSVTRVKYDGRDHLLETFFDLTERKRMELELERAHAEMDQIFQTASTAMRLISRDFIVMKVNRTFEQLAGVSDSEAVGRKCYEIFAGELCFTESCPLSLIDQGKKSVEYHVRKKRDDGSTVPCILTATPFIGASGEIIGIVESFLDITEEEKARKVIVSERDKLNGILSHLVEGVCIISQDHAIEYENAILQDLIEDCCRLPCYTVFHRRDEPCRPCLMQEVVKSGTTRLTEFEHPNGRSFEQSYTLITDEDQVLKVVVVTRDVTEEKNAMRSMMQAEQLAALGELSAGVAHEINNPINGIINYGQILMKRSESGSFIREIAERVIREGDRIARIVEGLLSFARRRNEEKSVMYINEALANSLMLTSSQLRKDSIIVRQDVPAELPPILAQAHEMEQVFINIISNARHALNEKFPNPDEEKILEIRAEKCNHSSRPYLRISFFDRGIGIPAHNIDKIRNPFFSTKSDRKRTGLGLSISHGIVSKHGGRLEIESVQDKYTKVHVDLPSFK